MRLVCDVLQDMRDWLEKLGENENLSKKTIKKQATSIEEAQKMVNKMEKRLFEYKHSCEDMQKTIKDLNKEINDLLNHRGKYKRDS